MKTKSISLFVVLRLVRHALIITAAVSLLLVPAGCGASGGAEDDSFMEKYETTEKVEHGSVRFCFPGQQPKGWEAVKAEIESRSAASLNTSLDFKWIDFPQYIEQIKMNEASGEIYDAYCLGKPDSFYPDFTALSREGKLKDISELFPKTAPSLFSKYTTEELEYARVDGKLYAVPSLYPKAYCTYLMVDEALHDKYKLPEIKDLDDYEAYLKAIRENKPDLIPGTIANSVDSMSLLARSFDYVTLDEVQRLVYKWDDREMNVYPWEQTPEFSEAVYKVMDWLKKGYIQPNPDQSKVSSFVYYGDFNPPSKEPQVLTFMDSSGEMKQSNPMKVFYLYPEKKVQRDNPMGSFYFNGSFIFPAASLNTERALRFIDWVQQSRENYFLVKYGIEGSDYVLKEGYPIIPDGMDFNNRTYMYWDGNWAIENAEFFPSVKDGYGAGIDTMTAFLDKYTKYPPHGAFYPNYKTVQEAADERSRAFQQFEFKLGMGQITDFSEVEAFIREMKDIGTENLVAEVRKQILE